jgi:hypothetical protein
MAVGSVSAHNQDETPTLLAEHWNGAAWSIEHIALPPDAANASFSAISCPTPADCLTVGQQGANQTPIVERSS